MAGTHLNTRLSNSESPPYYVFLSLHLSDSESAPHYLYQIASQYVGAGSLNNQYLQTADEKGCGRI